MCNAAAEDGGMVTGILQVFSPVSFVFLVWWACSKGYKLIVITQSLTFWHKIYNIVLTEKAKEGKIRNL